MITITDTDFNLKKILHESKLSTFLTRYKYHVVGLRTENNPAILIEYQKSISNEKFKANLSSLAEFLERNGMEVQIYDDSNIRGVSIGLRRDVRSVLNSAGHPVFAASLLCTVVYSLENRVDIEQMKKYKLPSMPTFTKQTTTSVSTNN